MSKHTPGPWRVEVWKYQNPEREELTVQTNKDAVAQVCDLWPPDVRSVEQAANARLIAKAPKMRELLARFTDEWGRDDYEGSTLEEIRLEALDVLAEIDGEEKESCG